MLNKEFCSITPEVNQHSRGCKWSLWLRLLDIFVGKRVITALHGLALG